MTISRFRHPIGVGFAGSSPTASVAVAGAGKLVCVAGQLGTDERGRLDAEGSAADQVRHAFANVARVLGQADLGLRDVLRFTTYIVGRENVAVFQEVRDSLLADVYPDGIYPPNTLVVVAGLFDERCVVEIEAWAMTTAEVGERA